MITQLKRKVIGDQEIRDVYKWFGIPDNIRFPQKGDYVILDEIDELEVIKVIFRNNLYPIIQVGSKFIYTGSMDKSLLLLKEKGWSTKPLK